MTQLCVRIDDRLGALLEARARSLGLRRSDVVRRALEREVGAASVGDQAPLLERMGELVGSVDSGIPDLGSRHREHIIERLRHEQ
jgi:hypothetical protein